MAQKHLKLQKDSILMKSTNCLPSVFNENLGKFIFKKWMFLHGVHLMRQLGELLRRPDHTLPGRQESPLGPQRRRRPLPAHFSPTASPRWASEDSGSREDHTLCPDGRRRGCRPAGRKGMGKARRWNVCSPFFWVALFCLCSHSELPSVSVRNQLFLLLWSFNYLFS